MQLTDFDFDLPNELIARYPLPERSASRLMCLDGNTGELQHAHFRDIVDFLRPNDLLVFNDTKVIPARLFGCRATGGKVEVLVERLIDDEYFTAQVRASKSLRAGEKLHFAPDYYLEVIERKDVFYTLRYIPSAVTLLQFIHQVGQIPLPPYMQRRAEALDKTRYQTVYARLDGSVAAPTAGFHFDEVLLEQLRAKEINFGFLTLHIGAGTFSPVRVSDIRDHQIHREFLNIDLQLCEQIKATKEKGGRIIAVGTTSMRALETAAQSGTIEPFMGETNIFIYPGYHFQCVDAVITNLHLPQSTLLMLISAFAGHENVMHAYAEAVKRGYRFYSYGDAMFIKKQSI